MLTKSFQSLLCCLQVISQLLIEIFCLILTTKVSEVNCTSQTFLLFTATVLKEKKIYCSKGSVIQSLKQTNKAKGHVQTNQKQFSLLSVKLKMVQIGYTLDHAVAGSFYCEDKRRKKKQICFLRRLLAHSLTEERLILGDSRRKELRNRGDSYFVMVFMALSLFSGKRLM